MGLVGWSVVGVVGVVGGLRLQLGYTSVTFGLHLGYTWVTLGFHLVGYT